MQRRRQFTSTLSMPSASCFSFVPFAFTRSCHIFAPTFLRFNSIVYLEMCFFFSRCVKPRGTTWRKRRFATIFFLWKWRKRNMRTYHNDKMESLALALSDTQKAHKNCTSLRSPFFPAIYWQRVWPPTNTPTLTWQSLYERKQNWLHL